MVGAVLIVVWVVETFALGYLIAANRGLKDENDVLKFWRDTMLAGNTDKWPSADSAVSGDA